MRELIQDSITRLLRFQRAPSQITRRFRNLKHNADILPKFQGQLEMVLDAYGRFEPVVYDCQGINDCGSDISIRIDPQSKEPKLICFQVKSFDDMARSTYLQELKAQRDDSFRKVRGLQHYFILICTDFAKHREKIRSVMAEFRSADKTEVIEPTYAYTFLYLPKTRIEALITRFMEAEDHVFRAALQTIDSVDSPSAKALTVFMAVRSTLTGKTHFALECLFQEPVLRVVYEELRERQASLLDDARTQELVHDDEDPDEMEWEDSLTEEPLQLSDFEDQLAVDIEALENVAETDTVSGDLILRKSEILALTALATDAMVRYDYGEEELMSYMFNLMGVRD